MAETTNPAKSARAFSNEARLDDGTMWPTSFALLTAADEASIGVLVKQAAS